MINFSRLSGALLALAIASGAQAALIDMTAGGVSSANVNGALFEVSDPNTGAGSGAIDSFLRTQNKPLESGYNTDGAFEFDQVAGCCTHSVQIGDLSRVTIDGNNYFELRLDINEPGGKNSLITLQQLEIWVNTSTGADEDYSDGLGTKVWDLGDNMIEMDGSVGSSGSGDFDYDVLFSESLLTGYGEDAYFYLFNEFGDVDIVEVDSPSEAGFEEWAAFTGGSTSVPVPAAVWLFGSALGMLGWMRRRAVA